MWKKFVDDGDLGLGRLRPGADFLLQTIMPFLQGGEISQNEFRVDHVDIADRIDRAADMMDVGAFKTAHYLHNRVHFPNVTEKLIAESFASARTFH